MLKDKNWQPRILHPVKIALENEGEIRNFQLERKLESVTNKLTLKK
jgi:hypothetical protein